MGATELLRKLVSIPSVFPNEGEISKYLGDVLSDYGFSIRKVKADGRECIVATYGRSRKYLCLYGHMDTVPPNAGMDRPYELKERKGIGTGLGAADMKGGVAAIVTAARTAVENDLPLKVALGVDEENISAGAHAIIDSGALKDVDFMICGESGGESGNARSMKEPFNVCYGRKGRVLFDATVSGVRTHAATRKEGINAIVKSSEFVCIADAMRFPRHAHLGDTDVIIQSISGEADSFSLPDACNIEFSVIATPNVRSADVVKKLYASCKRKNIAIDIGVHTRATPYGESYEIDRRNPFIRRLESRLFRQNRITPLYAASVADENMFANRLGIPVISMGPVSGGFHSVNEWIRMDSLNSAVEAYERAIELYNSHS
jgi:succinyl-diaminopimelate desuccinylase